MRYQLEKYTNPSSRHQCPSCGDKKSFAYYRGEDGSILDVTCGRCNHEVSCGYHYTPSDWFRDHPDARRNEGEVFIPKRIEKPVKRLCTVPIEYVRDSMSFRSNFIFFLSSLFSIDEIEALMRIFKLGATKDGSVIFWQIDSKGQCRSGKIIQYDPDTGHRIKDEYRDHIKWVHPILKMRGVLPDDWELSQCLFGAHQLRSERSKGKKIVVVESEKTAVIGTAYMPEYVWMACGGLSQLSAERCYDIHGRDVILYPDTDTDGSTYRKWKEKAEDLKRIGCRVDVSDILERTASAEDKEAKIDIGDVMIRELQESRESPMERRLRHMRAENPVVDTLIDVFDLIPEGNEKA